MAVLDSYDNTIKEDINLTKKAVRTSLTSVLNRIMSGDIFDKTGWLKIGVVKEQANLAEKYINTGSLYMFMAMFMITAIDAENVFWQGEKVYDYSSRLWNGENLDYDEALEGWKKIKS